jgi:mannosylfructose-phosphate synthase
MNITKEIKSIAMLSTHGYFDPIPQLGRTDTGGQVVYVLELAKAISRLGIKVDIYTRWFEEDKRQIDPVPDCPNVNIIRIKAGPWEFIPKEFIYDILPELSTNMINFIKQNKLNYDLYHGHYIDAGIVTVDVAKAFGKPSFFTAHSIGAWKKDQMGGDPVEMEKKFNFEHRIAEEIRIFKAVNAQTVTSIVQLEKLEELYNYKASNIADIPPGVDIHTYHLPEQKDLKTETSLPKKYVFCISRIDTNKGHDFLLHAFDLVRKKIPDIDLVIGGGSPNPKQREIDLYQKMKDIIQEKGMDGRVQLIGYVADELMPIYYQQSEMFVLPSLFEPFGMTTQEAMACGKAVIASKFGGIRNVIEEGKNGLLVDPSNAEEFANAMIKLLEDPKKTSAIGTNAYQTVQDHFSWEAIANRFIDFFKEYL